MALLIREWKTKSYDYEYCYVVLRTSRNLANDVLVTGHVYGSFARYLAGANPIEVFNKRVHKGNPDWKTYFSAASVLAVNRSDTVCAYEWLKNRSDLLLNESDISQDITRSVSTFNGAEIAGGVIDGLATGKSVYNEDTNTIWSLLEGIYSDTGRAPENYLFENT